MDTDVPLAESRDDRRAFISGFAAKMQKVEDLKIEGGVPRDERRETLRAMGACPLRKVVLIGVNSPAGNTWGLHGADIESHGIKFVSSLHSRSPWISTLAHLRTMTKSVFFSRHGVAFFASLFKKKKKKIY